MYTDGLEWNMEYYFKGKSAPTSSWYYPYSYSPTMKDVSEFITVRTCTPDYLSSAFVPKIYTSTMQLLIVLPPESITRYLPDYSRLLTDPSFECMDMYPVGFKLMTYLKYAIWECSPILPEVDEERLEKGIDMFITST
jgi:5'-3' exonuclease